MVEADIAAYPLLVLAMTSEEGMTLEKLIEMFAGQDGERHTLEVALSDVRELEAENERLRAERLSNNDLHYLRSILGHLREIRSALADGPRLGGEVLADNIDWLDCFIDRWAKSGRNDEDDENLTEIKDG